MTRSLIRWPRALGRDQARPSGDTPDRPGPPTPEAPRAAPHTTSTTPQSAHARHSRHRVRVESTTAEPDDLWLEGQLPEPDDGF
jgi:hypothetical protein